ncbi:MAG: threonine ammonia-lyase [Acidobacteriota bacterium]
MSDVASAHARLSGRVIRTPLRRSEWLSRLIDADVWLKLECVQLTGSFKIRGALNAAILHAERHAGVPAPLVTASAGNHGRALALAAEQINVPLTVFVPENAPKTKIDAIRNHGATLVRERDYDAAEAAARAYAEREGATFVSPYNDADVIAGAGTVALEVFDDLPEARTLVVPVGGGGLASAIGLVCQAQPGKVSMIGVEAEASQAFSVGLRAGRITTITPLPTLADGLGGNLEGGSITFPLMQQVCDGIVTVSEDALGRAIAALVGEEHLVAEGAGAAAVAAIAERKAKSVDGAIVAIVSGSNIDLGKLVPLLR